MGRENRPVHRGDWFLILFRRVVRKPFTNALKQISVRPSRWARWPVLGDDWTVFFLRRPLFFGLPSQAVAPAGDLDDLCLREQPIEDGRGGGDVAHSLPSLPAARFEVIVVLLVSCAA